MRLAIRRTRSISIGSMPMWRRKPPAMRQLPITNHQLLALRTRAFVKIQDGCNMSCTYCIIPLARGKEQSRSIAEVVDEVKKLVQYGLQGNHLDRRADFGVSQCHLPTVPLRAKTENPLARGIAASIRRSSHQISLIVADPCRNRRAALALDEHRAVGFGRIFARSFPRRTIVPPFASFASIRLGYRLAPDAPTVHNCPVRASRRIGARENSGCRHHDGCHRWLSRRKRNRV